MKRRHLLLAALSLICTLCMCFCLAACDSCNGEPVVLATPVVTVGDDGIASWDAVENASGYAYKIGDGKEESTDRTSVLLQNGQSIAVKAVGDGKNFADSGYSEAKTYTKPTPTPEKLGTPTVTINDDGVASWNAVPNAVKYACIVDGGAAVETTELSRQLNDGQSIKVKAIGNGTQYSDSDYSAVKTYTAPQDPNKFTTHEEYLAATDGTSVRVKGVVTGITANSIYLQDGDGGYYVYGLTAMPENLAIGKTVIAAGKTKLFEGLQEIENATVEVTEDVVKTVEPKDITELLSAATLDNAALNNLQSTLVTVKGVTLGTADAENKSFTLTVGSNNVILYINGKQCIDTAAQDALKALFTANTGKKADVIAFATLHGNFQLAPAPANTLTVKGAATLPAPEVTIDGEGLAKWNAVDGATKYIVKIGESETEQTELSVRLTDKQTIQVKAVGDGVDFLDSAFSAEQTYNVPALVDSLTFDFANLNGNYEELKTAKETVDVLKNSCNVNTYFEVLVNADNKLQKVYKGDQSKNIKNALKFSTKSEHAMMTISFMQNVKEVIVNCGLYGNDKGSQIIINGVAQEITGNGNLTFKLDSPAQNVKIEGSGRSFVYSITVNFGDFVLSTPEPDVDENGLVSWEAVPDATGYKYVITDKDGSVGAEMTTPELSIQLNDGDSIEVWAYSDVESIKDSPKATAAYAKIQLAAPVVTQTPSGAEWNDIENASSYKYTVTHADGTTETFTTDNTAVRLADKDKIVVIAVGTGKFKDSEPSEELQYNAPTEPQKIKAPDIEIGRDGTATWSQVAAVGFVYKINDGEEVTVDKDTTTYKLNNGETISVKAKAPENDTIFLDSDYATMTYKAPEKLDTPANVAITIEGSEAGKVVITWDANPKANGYAYVTGDGEPVETQDNTVTITLAEGETFKVSAIGDDNTSTDGDFSTFYNDSDYCAAIEFVIDNEKTYTVAEILPIIHYYGSTASAKAFTVSGVVSENTAYSTQYKNIDVTLKDGDSTVVIYRAGFASGVGSDTTKVNELVNWTVTATGNLIAYSSSKAQVVNGTISALELSAADRVKFAKEALTLKDVYYSNFELPLAGEYGTVVSWAIANTEDVSMSIEIADDGKSVTILQGETDVEITLTATITYGEGDNAVTDTKDITFTIPAEGNEPSEPIAVLTIANADITKVSSGSGYTPYNGSRIINGYNVTTNQAMPNTQSGTPTLQFQKANGYLTVNGAFTSIEIVYYNTNSIIVTAGGSTLTGTTDTANKKYIYNVGGSEEQEIKISAGNNGAVYLVSITFYK